MSHKTGKVCHIKDLTQLTFFFPTRYTPIISQCLKARCSVQGIQQEEIAKKMLILVTLEIFRMEKADSLVCAHLIRWNRNLSCQLCF